MKYKILILSSICSIYLYAQQPAFPGAEGGGKFTWGGRGGKVLEVTTLLDTSATDVTGTLRWAVNQSGARTVVFRISGTIILNSELRISKDSITIAGQTAPGDGICLRKYPMRIDANNVVVRYLRFRLGDESGREDDAFNSYTNNYTSFINHTNKHHIIVDHCSASWSEDETLTFYGNDSVTVQWCIISESLYNSNHPKGKHGYGGIWGGRGTSFHHNLFAHHDSRNPRFSGGQPTRSNGTVPSENVDFRNNVIYNWGSNSSYGGESSTINMVANYYKPGPATRSTKSRIIEPFGPDNGGGGASLGQFYVAENYVDGNSVISNDNWAGGVQGTYANDPAVKAATPFPYAPVITQTAVEAFQSVLTEVGAKLPKRDTIDARIVHEAETGTATFGGKTYGRDNMSGDTVTAFGILDSPIDVGGWPVLNSAAPPVDADSDGMPDAWEAARGLNPNYAEDRNIVGASGYTKLEEYLNELAGTPTVVQSREQLPSNFELLQNYPNPFNPSTTVRYSLSAKTAVHLSVFDILGHEVAILEHGTKEAGEYTLQFNAVSQRSIPLTSGIYFCRLKTETSQKTIKLLLIR